MIGQRSLLVTPEMSCSANTPACFFCVVSLTLFFLFSFSVAADSLTPATPLLHGQTLVSSGAAVKFELGFFSPANNSNATYLGIWYKQDPKTVVWVANRNKPITGIGAVLRIGGDGQLLITLNQTRSLLWSSNSSKLAQHPRAQLLETGNFVVMEQISNGSSGGYLWQSFDYPTDTLLPGARFGRSLNGQEPETFFTSWKSPNDPSSGDSVYRFIYRGLSEQVIDKGSVRKYRTGPWNGVRFSGVITLNQAGSFVLNFHDNMLYNLYMPFNTSFITRIVIDSSGLLNWYLFDEVSSGWNLLHTVPNDPCENYRRCGANGICSVMRQSMCDCLKGFTPKVPQNWQRLDWTDGCVRRVPLNCTKGDRFFKLVGVKLPNLLEFRLDTNMSLKQCETMCSKNCSCTAYANSNISHGGSGCLLWFGDLIDVTEFNQEDSQEEMFIRLSASELGSVNPVKKKRIAMIAAFSAATGLGLVILGLFLWCTINRKLRNMKGVDLLKYDTFSACIEEKNDVRKTSTKKSVLEIPLFSLSSVSAATNNFSPSNKLGEGGFGPVYKGNLPNGEYVAIKRLSTRSKQGWDELKNEAVLIAKLQHKNLVKVVGCCIEGQEHLLVYEYLPNKSLDLYLFDSANHGIIDWMTRVKIIEGIAQGLLYLHQYSRLTIIHRDLKASNILLDKDMNPKISDFGMAIIYGGNRQGETNRIVGTYGYMAPEYALEGVFSAKSDVFSFGILFLEILSGRRNTSFYHTDFLNLVEYAWDLWTREKTLELKDSNLENICGVNADSELFTRFVHIALLCVQQNPAERPTMSEVVMMLEFNQQQEENFQTSGIQIKISATSPGFGGQSQLTGDNQYAVYDRSRASDGGEGGSVNIRGGAGRLCFGNSGLLRLRLSRCFKNSRKLKGLDGNDLSTRSLKGSLSNNLQEELHQVRFFSFPSVSAATSNFSASNKLGEGGFGPVYKGNSLNGDQVATKRLSKRSAQGWEELRNEVVLMSKLQHRNIVNLIGCCIEGEENIVIYEYLPNRSLDLFLFDSANHGVIIDWTTRVTIIQGIAQGLCYLHHYSTLTIIHLDLKPSNILLDKCMTPKISDFGLARIVAGDQEEGQTDRIVGTVGYVAPEYNMHGRFSTKSDVFSFGILLLEILSGKKNFSSVHHTGAYLQNHAFELWAVGKALELKDPKLKDTDSVMFTRYVHIGLLCIQEDPAERPTMSQVVMMLGYQQYCLLPPKQPPFSVRRRSPVDHTTCDVDGWSVNLVTTSVMEAT